MMKFKEYLQINADDSIEQIMSGEWINKSRSTWKATDDEDNTIEIHNDCLLYTSPSPRDVEESRMPSSA